MQIFFASSNENKKKEVSLILNQKVLSFKDLCISDFPEETGQTYKENALIKVNFLRDHLKTDFDWILGEDSGLEVECLDFKPGLYSKRYAGINASDDENRNLMIKEIQKRKLTESKACFICELCALNSKNEYFYFKGLLKGSIRTNGKFFPGFAYDPIFYPLEEKRSLSEMSLEEKNTISHRFKAFYQFQRKM